MKAFEERYHLLDKAYHELIHRKNPPTGIFNGIYQRYQYPILTRDHIPLEWRYDFDQRSNPGFIERFGFNAVFNPGAIYLNGKYHLIARVESVNRKSFFAVAESDHPVSGFKFWEYPILMPETSVPDTNIYDMRIVKHEDGWLYGLFCTERKDPAAPSHDHSAAIAQCGIARTKDLKHWERLPDLTTPSPQQRNVVLHPEKVNGKYVFYTRPQDGFIEAGSGGGIGIGLVSDIENPVIEEEIILDDRRYHTISEAKNGLGPAPIKTDKGWLHLAHGVRNTAAGLRYVLYMFMTDLNDIYKITHKPGGYFMAPEMDERVGDVSNVLFSNGWVLAPDNTVYVYYASSDTRIHVASAPLESLLDYVMNNPPDPYTSWGTTKNLINLINHNKKILDVKEA